MTDRRASGPSQRAMARSSVALLATSLLLVRCASLGGLSGGEQDAAHDAGRDAGREAAGHDRGRDAGREAAGHDAGRDVGREAAARDAAGDAASDAPTPASISLESTAGNVVLGGSTVSTSVDVAAGNLLVVATYWQDSTSVGVSDTLGNAWVARTARQNSGGSNCSPVHLQLWYAGNVTGGSDTVTVTASGDDNGLGLSVVEYSGIALVSPLDTDVGQIAESATTAMSTGDLHTTGALDVVAAAFVDGLRDNYETAVVAGSGYAQRDSEEAFPALLEDDLPLGAPLGTYDPTATIANASACWVASAIAFKAQ